MGETRGLAIVRFMDAVDRVVVVIAQLLLVAMVCVTFVSVVGRTFFNTSVPDDLLINEMIMVALVFLPLSYVQSVGGHLEVTVLSDLLPQKVQNALVTAALVLGIVVFGMVAYLSWGQFMEAWESGEIGYSSVLDIPEWPAKLLIPFGIAWWCLRMSVQLVLPAARPVEADNELRQALEDEKYLASGVAPEPGENTPASTASQPTRS
jgi:TRAP-type C4-dicarboxylate transport system permease small subunit